MIQKLEIKNYKGFDNLKINELSNINLIGGENNIGKTSFLEAIFTFYDRTNLDVILKPLSWRGVSLSLKNNTPHEIWLPVFNNYNIDKTIELQFEYNDKRTHEVSISIDKDAVSILDPEKLAKHDNRNIQQENISEFTLHIQGKIDNELKQDTYLYFTNNRIARKVNVLQNKLKPAFFVSQTIRSSVQDVLRFSDVVREGLEDEVLNALKIIDNRIKTITPLAISEKESIVHVDIGIGKKIPIYYLGDGIVRLLGYILAILNTKNGIVLIDEIENGLHYSKQKDIWKLIFNLASRYNVQVFATTHSKEMTEAFIEFAQINKSVENSNYIELFRNYKTRKISANSIDIDTLQYKIHNNKNFRGE
jgi:AAA15 family ATPase/GTPase